MLVVGRPDDDDARRRIHFSVNDVSVDSKSTDNFMFILDAAAAPLLPFHGLRNDAIATI